MAVFNPRKREINAKVVYYGPGLSGKTTNLQYIHAKLKPEHRGELMTLATQQDRTLFFDYLPVELGEVRGLKTRFQLYTVPGQVFYNSTRKLVLKNVDGVVFVADSRAEALADNLESLKNLEENLRSHGLSLDKLPLVIQYNKRDAATALPIAELDRHLNRRGVPTFAAEAHRGVQVLETLRTICKLVVLDLRDKAPETGSDSPKTGTAAPATPPAPTTSPATTGATAKAATVASDETLSNTPRWQLATPAEPPSLVDGVLTLPLRVLRDNEEVRLTITVRLDLPE